MKIADADILIVPGYTNSGPEHWQSRWQARMSTARRVEQEQWTKPERDPWCASVRRAVSDAERPVILIAHSLGVAACVQAIDEDRALADKVAGAFLVAPPEVDNPAIRPKHLMTFGPYPAAPLPFPAFVVASRNDPFGSFERAQEVSADWGAFLVDAGEAGHINEKSGHGPWPEGLMLFAELMRRV